MRAGGVRGVQNLLSRRAPRLASLELSWFGGEPLLARDVVEAVQAHAQALARRHPELHLRADMTTNAWGLDRATFERLLALGVTRYQISLDGPRAEHDRKRLRGDGRGTFDRIWSHLLSWRDVPGDWSVVVRLHVDRDNEPVLPDFIARLGSELGGDGRFSVFLRQLSRWGGPNDAALPVFDAREWPAVADVLQGHLERCGLQRHRPEQVTPVCYAARANSFLVRADGRLGKCTLALDSPENQIGRIHADGRLVIDAASMLGWMRGLLSGDDEAMACPLRAWPDAAAAPGRAAG
jgi:uncharacterized protein